MPLPAAYLLGLALFGAALAGRFALDGVLPPVGFPFLTFFPAVLLATLFGGLGPGLLVSALSTVAAKYFFIPEVGSFAFATTADLIALAFFVAILLVDCAVIQIMNASLARVREERARVAELSATLELRLAELAERERQLSAALEESGRIGRDLAESEARHRALAADLERLAETRGRALAESEARLAQASKMEALGRLAGGVAHDFNNVLQAVQGALALARRRLATEPEAAARMLDLATDAAARGASVTGRLLSFARQGELRSEAVEPAPMLASLAEMLRPALGPQIGLDLALPPGLPALQADRGQLEAVLVNLVNNARDAMPAGGTITLEAEAAEVEPGQEAGPAPGAYLRLGVRDRGAGMPPEILARVTEPFFTTKPRGQGTGLGLAMARGFAEQSGGALTIESHPGGGTRVSLWLPRADRPAAPPPAAEPPAPPAAPAMVLLADDEADVRQVLRGVVEEAGHRVTEAPDADAALALLQAGPGFDVLVSDLAMPGPLDGLGLIAEARRLRPGLPALLVTGHLGDAAPGALEEAGRAGPFALLRKPVAPAALQDALAALLRGRSLTP